MVAITSSPEGEGEVEAWREERRLYAGAEPLLQAQPEKAQAIVDAPEAAVRTGVVAPSRDAALICCWHHACQPLNRAPLQGAGGSVAYVSVRAWYAERVNVETVAMRRQCTLEVRLLDQPCTSQLVAQMLIYRPVFAPRALYRTLSNDI